MNNAAIEAKRQREKTDRSGDDPALLQKKTWQK